MRKQGFMQKLMIRLAIVAFLFASYIPMNVFTARPAFAICGVDLCIAPGQGMVQAQQSIYTNTFIPAALATQAAIIAAFGVAMASLVAAVTPQITLVTRNITEWFETFWYYTLLPTLQTMTDQLSTMTADQSRALGSMNDAADQNRIHLASQIQAIETHREQRPGENVAQAQTITGGLTRGSSFTRAYNAAAPIESLPRSLNRSGTPAGAGMAADMKERWDQYTRYYCRRDENNQASGCAADMPDAGLDLDVTGQIFSKDTIDVRDLDTKRRVDDLILNIAEPFVKDPSPPMASDSAQGQEAILAAEAYKAKRQVIYDALYHVVARRVPGSKMDEFVRPLRLAAGIDNATISDNPSHNEIMQTMMSERFRTGRYALGQVDEPENNAREMVIQQAFQLMQMSDQLDLMDRYALILAAQVGAQVRDAKFSGTAASGAPLQ